MNEKNEKLVHLKIKIQSLVDESRNIRREANKTNGMSKWKLNHHRTAVVRPHARHNLLAYGCLRGIPYSVIEKKCHYAPNFNTVIKHAKKFGGAEESINKWVEDAKKYLTTRTEEKVAA
jgi:hypothetical protein